MWPPMITMVQSQQGPTSGEQGRDPPCGMVQTLKHQAP